jgi:type I restriction-modification system DNA methylase subunit
VTSLKSVKFLGSSSEVITFFEPTRSKTVVKDRLTMENSVYNENLKKVGERTINSNQKEYDKPRVENTHRRARIACHARENAVEGIMLGKMCVACAEDKYLSDNFKAKTKIEEAINFVKSARYKEAKEHNERGYGLEHITDNTYTFLDDKLCKSLYKHFITVLSDVISPSLPDATSVKLKELELEADLGKIPGYFPTPKELATVLVEALGNVKDSDRVLEPSAGKGSLMEALLEVYPNAAIDCVECNYTLKSILELKAIHNSLIHDDFMEVDFQGKQYDKILMNPPFEKKQDIQHITKAISLLAPGGSLVSIASSSVQTNSDKASQAFRALIDSLDGTITKLPEKAFSKADRTTNVNTVLVEVSI